MTAVHLWFVSLHISSIDKSFNTDALTCCAYDDTSWFIHSLINMTVELEINLILNDWIIKSQLMIVILVLCNHWWIKICVISFRIVIISKFSFLFSLLTSSSMNKILKSSVHTDSIHIKLNIFILLRRICTIYLSLCNRATIGSTPQP